MSVQVRTAGADDALGLATVQVESWRTTYEPLLPAAAFAALPSRPADQVEDWAAATRLPGHLVLAAFDPDADPREAPGGVVGVAWIDPEEVSPWGHVGELRIMHVLPGWRGQGIGRALLDETMVRLSASGRSQLWLTTLASNTGSRRFYARAGATLVGTVGSQIAGVALDEVAYAWEHLPASTR